jgi:hypothetical protein
MTYLASSLHLSALSFMLFLLALRFELSALNYLMT